MPKHDTRSMDSNLKTKYLYLGEVNDPEWQSLLQLTQGSKGSFSVKPISTSTSLEEFHEILSNKTHIFLPNSLNTIILANFLLFKCSNVLDKRNFTILLENKNEVTKNNEFKIESFELNLVNDFQDIVRQIESEFSKKTNIYYTKMKEYISEMIELESEDQDLQKFLEAEDHLLVLVKHKKFDRIRKVAEGLLLRNIVDPRSLTYIAMAFSDLGKWSYAEELLAKANETNWKCLVRDLTLAQIQVHKGQLSDLTSLAQKSLATYPKFNEMRQLLAISEFKQGNFDSSKDLIQNTKNKTNLVASQLNNQGIQLVHQKSYKEALDHYTSAQYVLGESKNDVKLIYNIALCYWRSGRLEQASKFLQVAIIKNPQYKKAQLLLEEIDGQRLASAS